MNSVIIFVFLILFLEKIKKLHIDITNGMDNNLLNNVLFL
jgi:hypothetical protein